MCAGLDAMANKYRLLSLLLCSAPTSVAAYNISSQTLYSLFRLPVKKVGFKDLLAASLKAL
jgi:hypothetical protein